MRRFRSECSTLPDAGCARSPPQVAEKTMVVRKGEPASCLRVIISGSSSAYAVEPQVGPPKGRRMSLAQAASVRAAKASVE